MQVNVKTLTRRESLLAVSGKFLTLSGVGEICLGVLMYCVQLKDHATLPHVLVEPLNNPPATLSLSPHTTTNEYLCFLYFLQSGHIR